MGWVVRAKRWASVGPASNRAPFSLSLSLSPQAAAKSQNLKLSHPMEGGGSAAPFPHTTTTSGEMQQRDKKDAIDAEIARVNKLPANSCYAIHRMRVLKKLLHLMSIKRTTSQDEELELLFASLSL